MMLDTPRKTASLVATTLLITLCLGGLSGCTEVLLDRGAQIAEGALDSIVYGLMDSINSEIRGWEPPTGETYYPDTTPPTPAEQQDLADAVADGIGDQLSG